VNAVSQQGMPVGSLGSLRLARHTAGWSWSSLHGLVLRFRGDLSGQSARVGHERTAPDQMRARISGYQCGGTNARQSNKTGPDERLDSLHGPVLRRFGDLSGPKP